jgi:DNA-binding transcriptional regulator YiaG
VAELKQGPADIVAARGCLSLRQAALILGIHFNTLHNYEKGKRYPDGDFYIRLEVMGNALEFFQNKAKNIKR